jgi:peptidoglycan/xylan/chitin deacetylase (PgdA/CDA1 family)
MKRLIAAAVGFGMLLTACAQGAPRTAPSPSRPGGRPSASPEPSTSPSVSPIPTPSHSLRPTPKPSPSPSPSAKQSPKPSPSPIPTGGVPTWLVGEDLTALPTSSKVVALTFDAGANADAVPSILSTLAKYHVAGTFFLTGRWVQVYPQQAAQIAAAYPVGNHTFDHPDLTTLSDQAVRDEITQGAAAITAATGRDTHPLFRFPFGATNAHDIGLANSLGYGCFRWTVDTLGWEGTAAGTADDIVQRVLSGLRPGEIVIMHVGSNPDDHSTLDADALPKVIEALQARGYGFTTLDRWV